MSEWSDHVDVAVVGGGPAGLGAATRLAERGVGKVLVVERAATLGGVPSWYTHLRTFGVMHYKRLLTGADYAERLVARARRAGVQFLTSTQVLAVEGRESGPALQAVQHGRGPRTILCRAIVLATGCRERPRSALGVPGQRLPGVYNTSTALHFIDRMGTLPGSHAVIVGSEYVGFSAAKLFHGAGARVHCVVDETEERLGDILGVLYFLLPHRIPLRTGYRVSELVGRARLEAVRLDSVTGRGPGLEFPCDALVFTGRFVPNSELCRPAGIDVDARTGGPTVDESFRTNLPGVFACGNVLRGAESADTALAEGFAAAGSVHRFLAGDLRHERASLLVSPGDGIAYVLPQRISASGVERFERLAISARLEGFHRFPEVEVWSGGTRVGSRRALKVSPVKTVHVRTALSLARPPSSNEESLHVRLCAWGPGRR